jgi:hypothetical protein
MFGVICRRQASQEALEESLLDAIEQIGDFKLVLELPPGSTTDEKRLFLTAFGDQRLQIIPLVPSQRQDYQGETLPVSGRVSPSNNNEEIGDFKLALEFVSGVKMTRPTSKKHRRDW